MNRFACLLALLLLASGARAAEVRHPDGTVRHGKLVTLVLLGDDGKVYEYDAEDISLFLPGPSKRRFGPLRAQAGGTQTEAPPTPEGSLPPGQPGLELELAYDARVSGSDALHRGRDPGEHADVYVFAPENERVRSKWIHLGKAKRAENQTIAEFLDGDECETIKRLLEDDEMTRKKIVRYMKRQRRYSHRMRYVFREPVSLTPGPWVVYVNFPKLRRHHLWRGVRFDPERPTRLRYSWSNHREFGL